MWRLSGVRALLWNIALFLYCSRCMLRVFHYLDAAAGKIEPAQGQVQGLRQLVVCVDFCKQCQHQGRRVAVVLQCTHESHIVLFNRNNNCWVVDCIWRVRWKYKMNIIIKRLWKGELFFCFMIVLDQFVVHWGESLNKMWGALQSARSLNETTNYLTIDIIQMS